MSGVRPAGIIADRTKRILSITWEDGHESIYPYDGLRAICPCVECRGGHENMGKMPDPRQVRDAQPTDLSLERIEPVGAYAIQLVWSDGHGTGIYSWELLRAACPCNICLRE